MATPHVGNKGDARSLAEHFMEPHSNTGQPIFQFLLHEREEKNFYLVSFVICSKSSSNELGNSKIGHPEFYLFIISVPQTSFV